MAHIGLLESFTSADVFTREKRAIKTDFFD